MSLASSAAGEKQKPQPPTTTTEVLYVTHRVPFPPDKGDRIRNYHVLRNLAQRATVDLIALADEPVPAATKAALQSICRRVECVPVVAWQQKWRAARAALLGRSLSEGAFFEPKVRQLIHAWAAQSPYQAALVSCSALAPYLQSPELPSVRPFVDLVDVDSQKWFDFAEAVHGPKRWLYQFEGKRLRALEQSLPRWVQATAIVSPAETRVFESFAGLGTATTAMNGVDLEYFYPVPAEQPVDQACAFVGALDYLPNIDAACWFSETVWPTLHQRYPQAEFRIIGRKPTARVLALGSIPGVVVVGQVPDVRPYVAAAAVVVAPMRLSRGLQNKVLEAMAMAKPVVAASPALAALAVTPGKDLLQADTIEAWHEHLGRLWEQPEHRRQLATAARLFVEQHHHWDRCLAPLLDQIAPVSPLSYH